MPFDPLSEEQRELRELVRTLARERVAPRAAEIDESHEFPWDVVELFREQGVFGLLFDEEWGGTGTGTLLALVAIEELSKVCATSGLIIAVQELGSLGIKLAGTPDQQQQWLPRLASGELLCAYALTEAGSGSDSAAMRTTARLDGDEYVLDGSKRFITNAGVAGLYTVFAKTDPDAGHAGISAFLVDAEAPGFEVTRLEPKMGISGSTTGELAFDGCRIPAGNLLGAEGEGFRIAMRILDRSRPASPPRRSASHRARPITRWSTRRRARRWASRSRSTSSSRRSSPTWRRSARRRAASSIASDRWSTPAWTMRSSRRHQRWRSSSAATWPWP